MKLNKHRFSSAARVELLPLIDVIFLLLIFFIFVMLTMSVRSSIKVELPELVESQAARGDTLTITIDASNILYVNDQEVSDKQLIDRVNTLQNSEKIPILIRGDQQSELGTALQILDKLQAAGYHEIAFSVAKTTESAQ